MSPIEDAAIQSIYDAELGDMLVSATEVWCKMTGNRWMRLSDETTRSRVWLAGHFIHQTGWVVL